MAVLSRHFTRLRICVLASLMLAAGLALASPVPTEAAATAPAQASELGPDVRDSLRNDTSAPLSQLAENARRAAVPAGSATETATRALPREASEARAAAGGSAAVDTSAPAGQMPAFDASFEGVGNVNGVLPPDTVGDVGPDHYMQWVNISLAIWDKAGNLLVGPVNGNTLFTGFGGACETTNNGDPIVLYDHLSDRWMASQFAFPNGATSPPYYQCIAVSQTGDPTGAWHRYEFEIPVDKLNDYPKFGVWPDAYYMAVNQFTPPSLGWGGQGAVAFERDAMLAGLPAQMVYFDLFDVNPSFGGQLPTDLDGTPPPAGTPNYFIQADDEAVSDFETDRLSVFEFHVDWDNPANSTFGADGQPNYHLDTAAFDANMCGFNRSCVPQPGTAQRLDAISDRLMYRLQYRTFGDHSSLVVNHTVDVDGNDHAGVRWYELRDTGSGFSIHQQGTYAPDAENRWMGSAAMDVAGNIAVGYSVSSAATYPSIRVAGRLAGDPLGELSQGESEMLAGTGSQTHSQARWGDYSMMSVDPVDQCTFWFTTEYLAQTSVADWRTRIGHFKFPSCTQGPAGSITGTVTDAATGEPVEGATVTAGALSTDTGADGTYSFTLPVGTYDMTAAAFGYGTASATGVEVTDGGSTTQNFSLEPVPAVAVTGTVSDGSDHGWPLYAKVTVSDAPGIATYTDPYTGAYSLELPGNATYELVVEPQYPGYPELTDSVEVATDDVSHDVPVPIDEDACAAPGYTVTADGLFQSFDSEDTPDGWTVVDNLGNGETWAFDDPGGRGNLTGGSGGFAIVDSDLYGSGHSQDTSLVSPVIDLSAVPEPVVQFNQDFNRWSDELTDVDVSVDGGATWDNVFRQTGADVPGPRHETVPIPQAAGEPDVQVRFHYHNASFEFWWQVDNVLIGAGLRCDPIEGGLVAGHVHDLNTGDPVNGATVTSDDEPADATTTVATPDDPDLGDGFYWMFSSLTGSHPFSAAAEDDNYVTETVDVDVAADATTAASFQLAAGLVTVEPQSLSASMRLGNQTSRSFTVTNEGTAPAEVSLTEGGGTFEILGATGSGSNSVVHHPHGEATVVPSSGPPADDPMRPLPREALSTNPAGVAGDVRTPVLPPTAPGEETITHSASQAVESLNSVACNAGATRDNGYLRTFTLDDFDIAGDFDVTAVSFGVETATPAQPLTVNLYTVDGELVYDNMTLIGTADITLQPQELSLVTVPVTGTAPAGSTLVVEVDSPDLVPTGGRFFIGSNNDGQTAPSYLRSESCGVSEPTDTAVLGFPDMHIVMNVTGKTGGDLPWMTVNPQTVTLDPGESASATVGIDGRVDQPGTYTGAIRVGEDTPYDVDPVDVSMSITPPNNWGRLTGTVTGVACDGTSAPLEDAIVHIGGSGSAVTLTTDETGTFVRWIGTSNNPLQLIVAATDYVPQTRQARVVARQNVVQNFTLQALC